MFVVPFSGGGLRLELEMARRREQNQDDDDENRNFHDLSTSSNGIISTC
jgi:hypothetical protein